MTLQWINKKNKKKNNKQSDKHVPGLDDGSSDSFPQESPAPALGPNESSPMEAGSIPSSPSSTTKGSHRRHSIVEDAKVIATALSYHAYHKAWRDYRNPRASVSKI